MTFQTAKRIRLSEMRTFSGDRRKMKLSIKTS